MKNPEILDRIGMKKPVSKDRECHAELVSASVKSKYNG
jgi:hypothetical protein